MAALVCHLWPIKTTPSCQIAAFCLCSAVPLHLRCSFTAKSARYDNVGRGRAPLHATNNDFIHSRSELDATDRTIQAGQGVPSEDLMTLEHSYAYVELPLRTECLFLNFMVETL